MEKTRPPAKSPCLAKSRDGHPCVLLAPHDGHRHQRTVWHAVTTEEFD